MWAWNPLALIPLCTAVLTVVVSSLVYRARPRSGPNRAFAAMGLLAAGLLTLNYGLRILAQDPQLAWALYVTGVALAWPAIAAALVFASYLATPLTRLLRSRPARAIVAILGAAGGLAVAIKPSLWVGKIAYEPTLAIWIGTDLGVFNDATAYAVLLAYPYGSIAAASAGRRARSTPLRSQGRWIAWAFGLHTAILVVLAMEFLVLSDQQSSRAAFTFDLVTICLAVLVLDVVAAIGMAKAQIFGTDLRIKWTLSKGTVAAIFLAVFFVVAVVAENVLTNNLGPWIGGVAAGLLLFAIAPLQRLGERIADAAMPRVTDTKEYRSLRKLEVYQAAYEGMLADGRVTEKEKDVLATLAADLGLSPIDVRDIQKGSPATT